jgi:hypothetical protein
MLKKEMLYLVIESYRVSILLEAYLIWRRVLSKSIIKHMSQNHILSELFLIAEWLLALTKGTISY